MGAKKKKKGVKRKRSKSSSKTVVESPSRSRSSSSSKKHKKRSSKTKKKSLTKPTDPNEPKKSLSAYMLFKNETIADIQQAHSDKTQREMTTLIAAKWRAMSHFQRKPYTQQAKTLKNEYMLKLAEYQSSASHKEYLKKLKKWEKSQKKSRKKKKKRKKERGRKRKRDKDDDENERDSSLSSDLSEHERPIKRRRTMYSDDDSSALSEELNEIGLVKEDKNTQRAELSLRNVILDTDFGIPMPSTVNVIKNDEEKEELDDLARAHGLTLSEKFCYFTSLFFLTPTVYYSTNSHSNHNQNDEDSQTLRCRYCDRESADLSALQLREKQLHTKQCPQCRFKFCTASELEDHHYAKHDLFGANAQNVMDECNALRVVENGQFIMNHSLSTQKFIHSQSKWRQKQRMIQQMAQIEERVVVDGNTKKLKFDGKTLEAKGPINCLSFNASKRSNLGDTKSWRPQETERFYKILNYTGLNFVFMEVLYNKAISKQQSSTKNESESDSDGILKVDDTKKKKKKKNEGKVWRYRDSKALHKKYQKENRSERNRKRINKILKNVKFSMDIVTKIKDLVEKNEFKLKDEDYFEDTDVELVGDVGE